MYVIQLVEAVGRLTPSLVSSVTLISLMTVVSKLAIVLKLMESILMLTTMRGENAVIVMNSANSAVLDR